MKDTHQWINVNQSIPIPPHENGSIYVLILRPVTNGESTMYVVDFANYYAGKWFCQGLRTFEECGYPDPIEWWMPLPKPLDYPSTVVK